MWRKRAHTLATLTKLCSTKIKFECTYVDNYAFIDMKKMVGRQALLSCPNFSEIFIIHTDASKMHLGVVSSQNTKPIIFYLHKLTPAQINYTTTERELLSIVDNLK